MNVFPTFEIYKKVFADYISSLDDQTDLVYYAGDELLSSIVSEYAKCNCHPYHEIKTEEKSNASYLVSEDGKQYPTNIYGRHNMQNLAAARQVWMLLGKSEEDFFQAASTFNGAAKRLEYLADRESYTVIKDYAHSPSKVKAAVAAVRERYPNRALVVVCELHTYSSLNKDFIPQYKDCLKPADHALVHYDPEAMQIKRMPALAPDVVKAAFNSDTLHISNTSEELQNFLENAPQSNVVVLLMSSGNYGGIDLDQFSSVDKSGRANGE